MSIKESKLMNQDVCGLPTLPLPSIGCARAVRDGGIDAVAALNAALILALDGLAPDQAHELKHAFGRVMGEVIFELIDPVVRAFPELEPDSAVWGAVARERATVRSVELAR